MSNTTTKAWSVDYDLLREDIETLSESISNDPKDTTGDPEKDYLKAVDTLVGTAYSQGLRHESLERVFPWVIPETP